MKKGLRFQTKLMWAFFLATTLVSFSVIELTSKRVKRTYQRQFQQKFDGQVQYLIKARESRSEAQLELGRKMAEMPLIQAQLSDGSTEPLLDQETRVTVFSKMLGMGMGHGGQRGPKGGQGESRKNPMRPSMSKTSRIVAVMNLKGEMTYLISEGEKKLTNNDRGKGKRNSRIRQQLEELGQTDSQQVAFLPQRLPTGEKMVREVIITPVKDPDNQELLGALILSLSSAETGAERFIDRYHHEIGEHHLENAIFVAGQLFPSGVLGAKSEFDENDSVFPDLEREMVERMEQSESELAEGSFEAVLHGEPHYVHFCAINPGTPLETAWQVSAFPMSELKSDLADLRIKGSGIGLFGILIGMITSLFLSRSLSVPIRELSAGTQRISEGDLDTELKIRSGDEIGKLTESFNRMTADLRQKETYRELLEKVSDESVAQAMIEGTLNPELGGELKEVSVLFCDIRGFTRLTESMRPEEVIEMLNEHMTAMATVVREHFGVVDKFVGDEIMAVFGGLKSYGNDAANAAHCALRMIEERDRLNLKNGTDIQIGVGVATGEIVAGCMGSEDRLNYTVLGARVNLGARLCGCAAAGTVVIDDQTFARIEELQSQAEAIEGLALKGFSLAVPAWTLRLAKTEPAVVA